MPWQRRAVDAPMGFRPYDHVRRIQEYRLDSGNAAIYPGDLVGMAADGTVDTITETASPILGAAAGYVAAAAGTTVLVYDHPNQLFLVQDDSATTAMTAMSEGTTADVVMTTGSTTTFQSLQEIDSDLVNAGTKAIKVHRLAPCEAGSYASAVANQRRWVVSINPRFHQYATQSGV